MWDNTLNSWLVTRDKMGMKHILVTCDHPPRRRCPGPRGRAPGGGGRWGGGTCGRTAPRRSGWRDGPGARRGHVTRVTRHADPGPRHTRPAARWCPVGPPQSGRRAGSSWEEEDVEILRNVFIVFHCRERRDIGYVFMFMKIMLPSWDNMWCKKSKRFSIQLFVRAHLSFVLN